MIHSIWQVEGIRLRRNFRIHFSFWANFKNAALDSSLISLGPLLVSRLELKNSRIAMYRSPHNNLQRFIKRNRTPDFNIHLPTQKPHLNVQRIHWNEYSHNESDPIPNVPRGLLSSCGDSILPVTSFKNHTHFSHILYRKSVNSISPTFNISGIWPPFNCF